MKSLRFWVSALCALLFGCCAVSSADAQDSLHVRFLDVGQGDAVFIQAPNDKNVLYDAGTAYSGTTAKLREMGVSRVDLMIASHPHADHIGGMPEAIRYFKPNAVIHNSQLHTTRTFERFLESVFYAQSHLLAPRDTVITLGPHTDLHLYALPGGHRGLNDNSVTVVLEHGEFTLSLSGDAEEAQWETLTGQIDPALTPVAVHKSSHHGSRNGDTAEGIGFLRPEHVIISLGKDNRYAHPHREALELYFSVGAYVWRTDCDGYVHITAAKDGVFAIRPERTSERDRASHLPGASK